MPSGESVMQDFQDKQQGLPLLVCFLCGSSHKILFGAFFPFENGNTRSEVHTELKSHKGEITEGLTECNSDLCESSNCHLHWVVFIRHF